MLNLTPFKQVTHTLITDKKIKKTGDMWSKKFFRIWRISFQQQVGTSKK